MKAMTRRRRNAELTAARLGSRRCQCGHESARHTTAYPGVPYDEAKMRHERGERWFSSCVCVEFREISRD